MNVEKPAISLPQPMFYVDVAQPVLGLSTRPCTTLQQWVVKGSDGTDRTSSQLLRRKEPANLGLPISPKNQKQSDFHGQKERGLKMGYWIIDGKQMTDAEYEEHKRQEEQAKERVRREAALLMNKLGQTYEALTSLLEQNPEVGRQVTDRTQTEEEIYRKLRQNLSRANAAPRCRWVKQVGTACGSPQLRTHIYCYAHKQMMEARAMSLSLPGLEDANAIQIALMRVQKALIDDTISTKKAGLLLYSLQLAMTNIGGTTFGEADERELVTDMVDEEEAISGKALSNQRSAISQGENPFTTEAQSDTEESPGLVPRMNVERVEVPNVVAMRVGGASWDKPTPNWDGVG